MAGRSERPWVTLQAWIWCPSQPLLQLLWGLAEESMITHSPPGQPLNLIKACFIVGNRVGWKSSSSAFWMPRSVVFIFQTKLKTKKFLACVWEVKVVFEDCFVSLQRKRHLYKNAELGYSPRDLNPGLQNVRRRRIHWASPNSHLSVTVWPDGEVIFQALAIYNNFNTPCSIKIVKVGTKFCQKPFQKLPKDCVYLTRLAKFRQNWYHRL